MTNAEAGNTKQTQSCFVCLNIGDRILQIEKYVDVLNLLENKQIATFLLWEHQDSEIDLQNDS